MFQTTLFYGIILHIMYDFGVGKMTKRARERERDEKKRQRYVCLRHSMQIKQANKQHVLE